MGSNLIVNSDCCLFDSISIILLKNIHEKGYSINYYFCRLFSY